MGHHNILEVMSCAQKPSAPHSRLLNQVSCSSLAQHTFRLDQELGKLSPSFGISASRKVPHHDFSGLGKLIYLTPKIHIFSLQSTLLDQSI